MTEVHQRHERRKGADPSLVIARLEAFVDAASALLREWRAAADEPGSVEGGVEPLDLADPEDVRRWLDKLDGDVRDAIAAGEDATRPPGQRDLGRRTAREQILESGRSLQMLVKAARRGLPACPK
jgi:hypothetical protein